MRTVPLGEVAEINPIGDRPALDDRVSFVGMAQMDAVGAVARPLDDRSFSEVSKGYTIFRDGDILAAKITPCWENGKVGQARLDQPYGVGSTEFHVIRPDASLDGRYLLHLLRTSRVRDTGELRMTGSAGQRRVPATYLRGLEIPLPSLEEQRRIAAILDKADSIRAKRRQVLDHLDALTQSIFHDMFDAPSLPKSPLASIIDGDDRINYGVVQPGDEYPGGVPLIRVSDLMRRSGGKTSLKKIDPSIDRKYQRSRIKGNEILVSCVGSIGDVAEATEELVGCNIARAVSRVPISDPGLRTYVADYLRGETAQRYFRREIRLVAQPTLNVKQLAALEIPIPGKALTDVYEHRRAALASVWRKVERAIEHDEVFFASLQSRAFAGEL